MTDCTTNSNDSKIGNTLLATSSSISSEQMSPSQQINSCSGVGGSGGGGGGGGGGSSSGQNNDCNSPTSSSSSKVTTDTLFEPSVEMMVNDFDDERTLEEEEALAATESDDPSAELSSLQREGDMPIEELLALYNCSAPTTNSSLTNNISINNHSNNSSNNINNNNNNNRPRSSNSSSTNENDDSEQNNDKDNDDEPSELRKLYPETYNSINDQRLLRTLSRPPSEDEDDGEYSPDEDDYKKTIMVGSEFQAVIPEGLCKYDDALPYENDDKLLWDPTKLCEKLIEEYLNKAHTSIINNLSPTSIAVIPQGKHLRDDEQALYLLLQCGHNIEEALRRRRINAVTSSSDTMSLWSEDECRNFENGLRSYGKDFHSIQQSKVRTRSVGELVQFYYLWKKTERHDVFANKARLEKKKYSLHPGLTDYMDRFLEEQENGGGIMNNNNGSGGSNNNNSSGGNNNTTSNNIVGIQLRRGGDRSSSPGINCLLYTDTKRQRLDTNNQLIQQTIIPSSAVDPLQVSGGGVGGVEGEVLTELKTNNTNINSKLLLNNSNNNKS